MKAVILAGGLGTRFSEETGNKPKPMIEIGGKPILWHIMKMYSQHGIKDFVICAGYKGFIIKEYFSNYYLHQSNVTFNLGDNTSKVHNSNSENWNVTIVDTGESTMTGGRILRIKDFIGCEDFCLTYGDGVSDVNISKLIDFHKSHGKLATVTAVRPEARFGSLKIESGNKVSRFEEKPITEGGLINGGFFILKPKVFDFIEGDHVSWEKAPLFDLAKADELKAFKHLGFWKPMDMLRDKNFLEDLWNNNKAPWKIW